MDDYIKRADAINSTWKALYAYEDRTEEQFQNDPDLDLGDWALHRIFVQGVHAEGLKEIIGIPAADVAPVIHAVWYGEADGYADGNLVYDIWSCPICGVRFDEWEEEPDWNYCPYCGAKMDQEADE